MNVLFIGGTGIISSACSRLAVELGIRLTLINRGQSSIRPVPLEAEVLQADIHQPDSVRALLKNRRFDVVVNWVAYTPEQVETDLQLFQGRTGQYIFISSASTYHKPIRHLPITEGMLLHNPYWKYSRDKIACEERLWQAYRSQGFPVTIVRPSHTYDCTLLPAALGDYIALKRMLEGRQVVVHGDGTSLWALTHHRDFARGFVPLLGNDRAIGEVFHITSEEVLTWDQIHHTLARAAGVEANIVHIPSEFIAAFDPDLGAGLLGDKAHSVIFDNSKIRQFVPGFHAEIPFARGAEEIVAWFAADKARQVVDEGIERMLDDVLLAWQTALGGRKA
jgi:nucleoside-diphosphate-sugar epimerase